MNMFEKCSKLRFLHNLKKYQYVFKNNIFKITVTALTSYIAYILYWRLYHLGIAGTKNVLNCSFGVIKGLRNIKFGMVDASKI